MKEKALLLKDALKPTKGKIAVLIALVTVAAALMVGFVVGPGGGPNRAAGAPQGEAVRTITLERGDLASAVSTTGTIYSTKTTEVYSTLNYQVKTVSVSVGDKVAEGDILAELDTSSLEKDIEQKQASVWQAQSSAQQNLASAQQDLETYKKNLQNNYDTTLLNAKAAVTTAELGVETAQLDLQTAGNDARTARRNLQDARNGEGEYEESGTPSDAQLDALRDTLSARETALEMKQTNLEKAKADLEKAQATLKAAEEGSNDSISTYQNKIKSAQISNNFSDQYIAIEKLQADLDKCVILAPVSGTITSVMAVEGGSGSGLLFIIQNTDKLKVVTNIKEYDIGVVNIGDKVIIKADATGDREFGGVLNKIAPTSTLTATGAATTSTDAEYESEVTVSPGSQGLRIGMNTRLSIITDERKDVFFVPYEAVVTDPDGTSYIYAVKIDEAGKASYERISVQTGLETNLYVEISGDALTEGMQIARSAENVPAAGADSNGESFTGSPSQAGARTERPAGVVPENAGAPTDEGINAQTPPEEENDNE